MLDVGWVDSVVEEEIPWHRKIVPSFPANLILVVGQVAEESSPPDADATEDLHFEEEVEVWTSCVAEPGETLVEVAG